MNDLLSGNAFRNVLLAVSFALSAADWMARLHAQESPATKASAETPVTPEQLQFFESKVRPLLVANCFSCHAVDKQKGELRLDSRAALLAGGESGPAIVPGKPVESRLIQAINYEGLEMPPTGKLSTEKIAVLTAWIKMGAPWPGEAAQAAVRKEKDHAITDSDRAYWAFQPVVRPLPPVQTGGKHAIDAFIRAKLEKEGLQPNAQAAPGELVRRVYFDLLGLPPTLSERQTWTERLGGVDGRPFDAAAYAALIDDLLARPAYGEQWGRHWLDVVRFAQTNGYERDGYKPFAWRYRDYVAQSFQHDKPFDRFIEEQFAGDELPDATAETRIATGFFRLGVWDDEPDDKRQAEFDELDDIMVTTGAAFLGLTLGCARCHDHKFDPIPQQDYYRLLAFVRNIRPYANPEQSLDGSTLLPINDDDTIRAAVATLRERQQVRAAALAAAKDDAERKKLTEQKLDVTLPGLEWTLGVRERPGVPPATQILIRGSAGTPGIEVAPGFLSVLSTADVAPTAAAAPAPLSDLFPTSGRRQQLARWIASRNNPLTARVLVNRVWHYHFGRGIVSTTGDFGKAGTAPTHPELLDWLASEFIDRGWSIKQLHRTILQSDTYRRSSHIAASGESHFADTQRALEKDPGNVWLWRQNLRRLDAEAIRDSQLTVSGELNTSAGGREMFPRLSGEVLAGQSKPGLDWEPSLPAERLRRSLYAIVKRGVRDPLMEAFDYANTISPLTERPTTTVAPQALILLNGRFTAERATALAGRVIAQSGTSPRERIETLYALALQRQPTDRELQIGIAALERMQASYRPLAGLITFRPDVPLSLFSGYRQRLAAEDYFVGPGRGWNYSRGLWGGGYEGIDVLNPRVGPFALWQGPEFLNGEVRGRLKWDHTTELATLLCRAQANSDQWSGVGITFDRKSSKIELRERQGDKEQQFAVEADLPSGTWLPFRLQLHERTLRLWFGDAPDPVLERPLQESSLVPGQFGIATWGGGISFDILNLQTNDRTFDLAREVPSAGTKSIPNGWSRYDGDWTVQPDGNWRVQPNNGAKVLWDAEPIVDGEVRVEMKMTPNRASIGGLVVHVSEPQVGADNWYGYEISLNAGNQTVMVGEHRHNWRQRQEQKVDTKSGVWHKLRAVLTGKRVQVYVDDSATPQIDDEVDPPLTGSLAGLRTWGSEIEYRNFEIIRGDEHRKPTWQTSERVEAPHSDQAWAQRQALEALCRAVLNLNEFVYVD